VVGLTTPVKEGHNVFCDLRLVWLHILIDVLVLNRLVVDRLRHTNSTTGKVGIEVHPIGNLNTSRCFAVSVQQGKQVVLISLSCLVNESQIWWKSTVVRRTRLSLVFVWTSNKVEGFSLSCDWVSVFVWILIDDAEFSGDFFDLVPCEKHQSSHGSKTSTTSDTFCTRFCKRATLVVEPLHRE